MTSEPDPYDLLFSRLGIGKDEVDKLVSDFRVFCAGVEATGYTRMLAELQGQLNRTWVPFLEQVEQLRNRLITALPPIDMAAVRAIWEVVKDVPERRRIKNAFDVTGFIPSPSMNTDLVYRIVEAHESGASEETLAGILLSFYDADNCAHLAPLVDRLCASSDFADRAATIQDTFRAHQQHLDSITSYPLVAMIEGTLLPFLDDALGDDGLRKLLGKRQLKHSTIAEVLNGMPFAVATRVGLEGYACLISYFKGRLYRFSDWNTDPELRRNYVDLNRHLLLHGMVSRGTRANTLRCFFILDLIATLLPVLRKELGCTEEPAEQPD